MAIAETIVCVECGGVARLAISITDDDELEVGEIVMYRCDECWGRFDLVVEEDDLD
jgi:DNA-directed RNA polymerase subunit RPC12/RpoP